MKRRTRRSYPPLLTRTFKIAAIFLPIGILGSVIGFLSNSSQVEHGSNMLLTAAFLVVAATLEFGQEIDRGHP
jgi:hypothetical protein